jgi:HTH-type transcriptional regulator/antitoxin HipB
MSQYAVRSAEQLPALLKAFRKQAGLTQGQLATRLGMTQQTLSALERNANRVSADRLLQLLGILGVDMVLQPRDLDASPRRSTPTGEAGW